MGMDFGSIIFRGSKATLEISRAALALYEEDRGRGWPKFNRAERRWRPEPKIYVESEYEGTSDHLRNWLECIRSRKEPNAPIRVGVAAARCGPYRERGPAQWKKSQLGRQAAEDWFRGIEAPQMSGERMRKAGIQEWVGSIASRVAAPGIGWMRVYSRLAGFIQMLYAAVVGYLFYVELGRIGPDRSVPQDGAGRKALDSGLRVVGVVSHAEATSVKRCASLHRLALELVESRSYVRLQTRMPANELDQPVRCIADLDDPPVAVASIPRRRHQHATRERLRQAASNDAKREDTRRDSGLNLDGLVREGGDTGPRLTQAAFRRRIQSWRPSERITPLLHPAGGFIYLYIPVYRFVQFPHGRPSATDRETVGNAHDSVAHRFERNNLARRVYPKCRDRG